LDTHVVTPAACSQHQLAALIISALTAHSAVGKGASHLGQHAVLAPVPAPLVIVPLVILVAAMDFVRQKVHSVAPARKARVRLDKFAPVSTTNLFAVMISHALMLTVPMMEISTQAEVL
jgi:hypothetical protein